VNAGKYATRIGFHDFFASPEAEFVR
jgi:hypothetical protein